MTRGRERGSASVELAVLTPLLLLLALLVVLGYRVVAAGSAADAAAHAAARAATLERTPEAAQSAAEQASAHALRAHPISCASHELGLELGGLEPGAAVTASVACTADLAGLTGLSVPGTYTTTGEATAVVDRYRGTP